MNRIPDLAHHSLIYSESCMSFKEKKFAQFEFTWMRWPLALSLHNNPDNIMYAWF